MKRVAIIQARMDSSRLYGKVLELIESKPLLELIIDRLRTVHELDEIVVATSRDKADQQIKSLAEKNNIISFTGSKEDVLGRFIETASFLKATHILRVTGDNPLIDVSMLPRMINTHIKQGLEYTSISGLPLGAGTEMISFDALKKVGQLTTTSRDREHVTIFIREHPTQFKIQIIPADRELYAPQYRITVDEEKDLQLVREIYRKLYRKEDIIELREVISLLQKSPALREINANIRQTN